MQIYQIIDIKELSNSRILTISSNKNSAFNIVQPKNDLSLFVGDLIKFNQKRKNIISSVKFNSFDGDVDDELLEEEVLEPIVEPNRPVIDENIAIDQFIIQLDLDSSEEEDDDDDDTMYALKALELMRLEL